MNVPKGAAFMPEGLMLSASDLQTTLDNLMQDHFCGYLLVSLPQGGKGFVFLRNGELLRAFESSSSGTKLFTPERLFAKAGDGAATSSYVLTAEMVETLAFAFALENASPQGWKEAIQQERQTGFVEFAQPFAGSILYQNGEPIHESMTTRYGDVVCGREGLAKLLNEGKPSKVFVAGSSQLEEKARKAHKDLDHMRAVKLKSVSGFFATKDALKVEPELIAGWGANPKGFNLVVETPQGTRIGCLKTVAGPKKPGVLEIPLKILQEWGVQEDQEVLVYPE